MFKRYPKVHRLGKEETDGILSGDVHVEEKIDGANAQIWIEDGKIAIGSRNNTLCSDVMNPVEGNNYFNGFLEYVAGHEGIKALLTERPRLRLYGEWLVKHTIHYTETNFKHFYLFDISLITDKDKEDCMPKYDVRDYAKHYGIRTPNYHGMITNPTEEQLMEFVGKSTIGVEGEGIVLKNEEFIDKFGDNTYAKIVTQNFKENNGITFGGNNKHSDTYHEMWVVNKFMTLARVQKIMQKLQPLEEKKLDLEHIPRIINTAYHDMLTEEIWAIAKKVPALDFKRLCNLSHKKAIQIYKDILLGTISVADTYEQTVSNDEGITSIREEHSS